MKNLKWCLIVIAFASMSAYAYQQTNKKKKVETVTYCTSKIPSRFAKKNKAKLMLDATGSIGLEKDHGLASVISFSSCKGST